MKTLLFTLLFSLISFANTQMKVNSMTPLHTFNHKLSIKLKKQGKLRSFANIKQKEALNIAASQCNQDIISHKLTHKGQLLFYRIYTKNCKVEINALDGAIISKVLL